MTDQIQAFEMGDQLARIVARLDANGGGVGLVEEGIDRHGGVCDRIVLAIAQHGVRFRARVRATAFGGGCLVNHRAPP